MGEGRGGWAAVPPPCTHIRESEKQRKPGSEPSKKLKLMRVTRTAWELEFPFFVGNSPFLQWAFILC